MVTGSSEKSQVCSSRWQLAVGYSFWTVPISQEVKYNHYVRTQTKTAKSGLPEVLQGCRDSWWDCWDCCRDCCWTGGGGGSDCGSQLWSVSASHSRLGSATTLCCRVVDSTTSLQDVEFLCAKNMRHIWCSFWQSGTQSTVANLLNSLHNLMTTLNTLVEKLTRMGISWRSGSCTVSILCMGVNQRLASDCTSHWSRVDLVRVSHTFLSGHHRPWSDQLIATSGKAQFTWSSYIKLSYIHHQHFNPFWPKS